MEAKTLFDKIWDAHVVKQVEGGPNVLYIDRHFIHEVTVITSYSIHYTKLYENNVK